MKADQIVNVSQLSADFDQYCIGRIFSNSASILATPKSLPTAEYTKYLNRKVAEIITGKIDYNEFSKPQSFFTENADWDIVVKAEAIGLLRGESSDLLGETVVANTECFGSVLDGYLPTTGEQGMPIAVHCPKSHADFVSLLQIKSIADIKTTAQKYYWRLIDDMLNTNSAEGIYFAYHPDFGGRSKKISVGLVAVWEDAKLLKERKGAAAKYVVETAINLK